MKQLLQNKTALLLLSFMSVFQLIQAQVIFEENFSYPVGSLLTNQGWSEHSGNGSNAIKVTASTISYAGYLSSGIGNEVELTKSGQDVNKTFDEKESGVIYVSFLTKISEASTSGDYFFHLGKTNIGTDFRARIFVKRNSSNKLAFGIAQSSTTPNYSGFNYNLNTTYLVVLKFHIVAGNSNDYSEIIINPALNGAEPGSGWIENSDNSGTDLGAIGTVALRQGSNSSGPVMRLDGIRVSSNWAGIAGTGTPPDLTVNPTSLSGFNYVVMSGPSAEQSFTVSGSGLSGNIIVAPPSTFEVSTGTGSSFVPTNPIQLVPSSGTVSNKTIYVRLKAGLPIGNYDNQIVSVSTSGASSQSVICNGKVDPLPEPTNHANSFTATATSKTQIVVQWNDAVPAAAGYLIKGSAVGFSSINAPNDGTAESNGFLVRNVAAGSESYTFTGLTADKDYYFQIYAYNGTGSNINYKTDPIAPQAQTTTFGNPKVVEVIVPKYIQGEREPNNQRVPFAYRLQLINLNPNTTYRYINQVVMSTDGEDFPGAANSIYVQPDNSFVRTVNASLSVPGNYGELTTDASGSYTGWFITEPTGNDRFLAGNELYVRLRLNNGNNGTSAVTFLTTTSPITVLGFSAAANSKNGTAVRAESDATPKNFVFLYDNANGNGRPLLGTSIETTGADYSATSIAPFYRQKVTGKNGAWGGILPNMNSNGVLRIEERALADGSIVNTKTSTNGMWGTTNTVNPRGGIDEVLVITMGQVPLTAMDDEATTLINEPITFDILANDIVGSSALNPSSLSFVAGSGPNPNTQGSFGLNAALGTVTFTPVNGFIGAVSIAYRLCDLNTFCDTATITVNVIVGLTNFYPALGPGTLAFEDLWPGKGDYDFNDLVIDYQFELTTNPANFIEQIKCTFTLQAFGASFENGFGFQLAGNIDPFDLTVSGYSLTENYITLEANGTEADQTKPTIIVFDNAFGLMPHPGMGIGVNTETNAPYVDPVTFTVLINFKPNTYTYNDIDIANFNPFLIVNKNRSVEIHLPNFAPTALADMGVFGTGEDSSDPNSGRFYLTDTNLSWAINIYEKFDYPIEKQEALWVYSKFAEWAMSGGAQFPDWYKNLSGYRNSSLIYVKPGR